MLDEIVVGAIWHEPFAGFALDIVCNAPLTVLFTDRELRSLVEGIVEQFDERLTVENGRYRWLATAVIRQLLLSITKIRHAIIIAATGIFSERGFCALLLGWLLVVIDRG